MTPALSGNWVSKTILVFLRVAVLHRSYCRMTPDFPPFFYFGMGPEMCVGNFM